MAMRADPKKRFIPEEGSEAESGATDAGYGPDTRKSESGVEQAEGDEPDHANTITGSRHPDARDVEQP